MKAVNMRDGMEISSNELVSAGIPTQIRLSPDRSEILADDQDLSYISVELVDEKGIRNPLTEQLVNFEISGPGEIVAVGSSKPNSKESYQRPYRMTYQGRCLVILKSGNKSGEIVLKAQSEALPVATVSIIVK